jgi:hypothetical protein
MFSKLQQFYYIKHSNNANQFEQSEQMGENVSPCTFTNESDKFSLHITPALPHILKSIHNSTDVSIALHLHQVTTDLNHWVNTQHKMKLVHFISIYIAQ